MDRKKNRAGDKLKLPERESGELTCVLFAFTTNLHMFCMLWQQFSLSVAMLTKECMSCAETSASECRGRRLNKLCC